MKNFFKRRQNKFLSLIVQQAALTLKGLDLLKEYMDSQIPETAEQITATEKEADEVRRILIDELNRTFITPFDREDIHMLADRLDEIVDEAEEVARLADVYRIERLTNHSGEMARLLGRACGQIADAVEAVPQLTPVLKASKAVRTTETEGDATYYAALAELFDEPHEAIDVIKWKDIINQLENALDACEHVAGILEGIVLKHG